MKTWQLRKALDAHLERDSRSDRSCRAKSSFKNVHATHTPTPLRATCAWLCLVFRPEFVSSYLMNSQLACSHSQEWKAFVTLWWHSWHALSLECPWLQWGRSWTYLVCVSISCDSGALKCHVIILRLEASRNAANWVCRIWHQAGCAFQSSVCVCVCRGWILGDIWASYRDAIAPPSAPERPGTRVWDDM